ncbi:helix-turn-helix domain-containing protein [Aquisphaera insulae]|uniref:helix-turn-helix domain-containing protein n=1 Tax=Aquisphaera insulae TaxID=2712864 RepID=UPI0013E9BAF3|nr:helix-turn-helix domain-containing protein [Aquisphaera insulae]
MMPDEKDLSPLAAEMVRGMSEFCEAVESGEAIAKLYTIRTVSLDLATPHYAAEDVKRVRRALNASQSLLARFLGVSVKTVRAWEQGSRPVPTIAARYMDDILRNPEIWNSRVRPLEATGGPGPST